MKINADDEYLSRKMCRTNFLSNFDHIYVVQGLELCFDASCSKISK